MAEDFGTPIVPEEESAPKRNTALIIGVAAAVVVCCCCVGLVAVYYGIEPVMEMLDIPIPW